MDPTFLVDYRAGRVRAEEIDDYVARWHDLPGWWGPKLHTYLGLTWDEYKRWCVTGELPEKQGT